MDRREIAETLSELERKLRELERLFAAAPDDEPLAPQAPATTELRTAREQATTAMPAASGGGRLVDESFERTSASATSTAKPPPRPRRLPGRAASPGRGAIRARAAFPGYASSPGRAVAARATGAADDGARFA